MSNKLLMMVVSLTVMLPGWSETDRENDDGLKQLMGEASVVVRHTVDAPVIDGMLSEAVWGNAPELALNYADDQIDGGPLGGPWVKIICDDKNMYIGFHSFKGMVTEGNEGPDDSSVLQRKFIAITWKAGNEKSATRIIAVDSNGKIFFGQRGKTDQPWGENWKPQGINIVQKKHSVGWETEFKVPFAVLTDDKVEKLIRFNVLQRNWGRGKAPRESLAANRTCRSWKQLPTAAVERLLDKVNIHSDEEFGVLYLAGGKLVSNQKLMAKIKDVSQKFAKAKKEIVKRKNSRISGFPFSQAELETFFPGQPIVMVPCVTEPPVVDGDPGDDIWQSTKEIQLGFLTKTIRGHPVNNPTYVRIVSDSKRLYFLFSCAELKPEKIRATTEKPDRNKNLWREDICDVFLDVGRLQDEASNGYCVFEINAVGTHSHFRRRSEIAWDPKSFVVQTNIFPNKKLWVMEMSVAFEDLGITNGVIPAVWGANFLRSRTPDRGRWINRTETKDPAYLNFEFAWRGNREGNAHRPDAFGILCLQVGNALQEKLWKALQETKKQDLKKEFQRWTPPASVPKNIKKIKVNEKAKFAAKPKVTVKKHQAEITFKITDSSPVTVYIQNSQGVIVRRLLSGLLGTNAPSPLQSNVLSQKIAWDLKDDQGQIVPAGKYEAVVGIGLEVEQKRFLLWNPNALRNVGGLSVDSAGNVYVLQHDWNGSWHTAPILLVFDRNGNYLRQLIPYSNMLKNDETKAASKIKFSDGRSMPIVTNAIHQGFAPEQITLSSARFAVAPDGKVILLNGLRSTASRLPLRLLLVGSNGEMGESYLGPVLAPRARMRGRASIALSPDGRFAYVTGIHDGWAGYDGPRRPRKEGIYKHHVVYRLDLQADEKDPGSYPQPFLGKLGTPGESDEHFYKPTGVCTDADGKIYVADCWNDRIMVFSSDGKLLQKISVPGATQVEVHAKSGDLYVLSLGKKEGRLQKFKKGSFTTPECSMVLPDWQWAFMDLDDSQPIPRLWVVGHKPTGHRLRNRAAHDVFAVDDQGSVFKNLGTLIANAEEKKVKPGKKHSTILGAKVGHSGEILVDQGVTINTNTGKAVKSKSAHLIKGWDGRLYQKFHQYNRPGFIRRFQANGKEEPFPGTKSGRIELDKSNFEIAVNAKGVVYIMQGNSVNLYGPDGILLKQDFIRVPQFPKTSEGVQATLQLDRDDCVYVSGLMRPLGWEMPDELVGRLPQAGVKPSLPFVYRHLYGAVIKFGPMGGKVEVDKDGEWAWSVYYKGPTRCRAEGVEWVHTGLSPLRTRNVEHIPCSCEHARFNVDGFGRVYLSDALRFQCRILDKKGNTLLEFGRYGNMDDGKENVGTKRQQQPTFAWPVNVQVRGDSIFVTDKINKRIVKMKMKMNVEEKVGFEVKPF